MFDKILQHIAPHYCFGCDRIGKTLCSNCKHDIINESSDICILCSIPATNGVCHVCRPQVAYSRAWYVGRREDVLRATVDGFKFQRKLCSFAAFAELLHERTPRLPANTVVVPIPTIPSHIRQRGYDHCYLIAQWYAKQRNLLLNTHLLQRRHNFMQRGRAKSARQEQAKTAFQASQKTEIDRPHILIDDVFTTGATVQAAAAELKKQGVKEIYVAVVARQPLDD